MFWLHLEFRLCYEFKGMPEKWLRYYWCDGFIPENYEVDADPSRITGRVWLVDGQKQQMWTFRLLLPKRHTSPEEIDWSALLPPDNVTRWLGIDAFYRVIEIEPAVAVPDLE